MKQREPKERIAQGVAELENLIQHAGPFAATEDASWIVGQLRAFLSDVQGCKTLDGAFGVKRQTEQQEQEKTKKAQEKARKARTDAQNQADGVGMQKSADSLNMDKTALRRLRNSPEGIKAMGKLIAENLDERAITPSAQRRSRRVARMIGSALPGDKTGE